MTTTTYIPPDNPSDPEAAALDDDTTVFAQIVTEFDRRPRCEIRTPNGPCPRPARYHATCHDCGRGLVCKKHIKAFIRQADGLRQVQCNTCSRVFARIEDAVTVVKI